jgi:hypothetical protein
MNLRKFFRDFFLQESRMVSELEEPLGNCNRTTGVNAFNRKVHTPSLDVLFYDVEREMLGAEEKFPGNEDLIVALTEETGELAQALLQHKEGKKTPDDVYTEAIQVASTALKIIRKGSSGFPYMYTYSQHQNFKPTRGKNK